jgi:hypothetical protein
MILTNKFIIYSYFYFLFFILIYFCPTLMRGLIHLSVYKLIDVERYTNAILKTESVR